MIGIGVSPSLSAALGLLNEASSTEVLFVYQGRAITRDVIAVLVRYRLAQKTGIEPRPCSNGDTFCISS